VPRPAAPTTPRIGVIPSESRADAQARWQSIEIRHLAALAAVAREGSFSRAADRLDYVQSAISGQIAHLEQVVGVRLLERSSGTPIVELTDAGEVLLRHTDEILARFETAYADVSSLASRTTAAVRVGGLEHFSPRRIALILTLFRERHPFARLALQDPATETRGLEHVASGKLDLLICESQHFEAALTEIVLDEDDYVLLVQAGSKLATRRASVTAAEVASLRPIVPRSCAAPDLIDQLRELDIETHPSLMPESVITTRALVSEGLGAAITPSRLIDSPDPGTAVIELSHLFVPHKIVLVLDEQRAHSSAVYGFVHAVREICAGETACRSEAEEPGVRALPATVRSRAA
jgi:DNA-binding transcriptional LysR family regulator